MRERASLMICFLEKSYYWFKKNFHQIEIILKIVLLDNTFFQSEANKKMDMH